MGRRMKEFHFWSIEQFSFPYMMGSGKWRSIHITRIGRVLSLSVNLFQGLSHSISTQLELFSTAHDTILFHDYSIAVIYWLVKRAQY